MRSPYNPATQAALEKARATAKRRWRAALAALAAIFAALFYLWGYCDGMARMGYKPGAAVPARKE